MATSGKIRPSKALKELVQRQFNYTGRTYKLRVNDSVTFSDLAWGGGSKNEYIALDCNTGDVMSMDEAFTNPMGASFGEGVRVRIPPRVAVIEHSFFMGKDVGITIHVSPLLLEERTAQLRLMAPQDVR